MPVEKKVRSDDESQSPTDRKPSSLTDADTTCGSNRVQITALNHESRRSAFSPYRPSTVLTNLQRGNIQTQTPTNLPERNIHQLAAMGELFVQQLDDSVAIDEEDDNGFTPLLWAASYGQLSTVKLLLSKGANPRARGKQGETALLLATASGHVHVVKELIANGVDVNETDEDGNTALMFAAFGNHALCANELLKASADLTPENSNLDTVFSIAVKKQSKQVQIILEKHVLQLFN